MKIGATIWIFDQNHRVYRREHGRATGGPIYREHWVPQTIVAETRVSWLTNHRIKVPKKGSPNVAFTQAEVDEACWVHENQYKIIRKLETAHAHFSPSQRAKWFRALAKLIDYKEPEPIKQPAPKL